VKSLWAKKITMFYSVHLNYIIINPIYGQTIIQKLDLKILSHYQNQQKYFVMMLVSIWETLLSYDKIGVKTWIGGLFGLSHF